MSDQINIPELIIIGGSSRNVGKTALTLKIIEKYASSTNLTALKVTSIRPGESSFHGNHSGEPLSGYRIYRELDTKNNKDTSKMLKAGASEVYFIESPDPLLKNAFNEFLILRNNEGPIICESRSLRKAVVPGLFILLKHHDQKLIKPGFRSFELMADMVFSISPNCCNSSGLADLINWDGERWTLIERKSQQSL